MADSTTPAAVCRTTNGGSASPTAVGAAAHDIRLTRAAEPTI
jgi:hypothetical protein